MFGLGVGLTLGLRFGRGGREPRRARTWRAISVRSVLAAGLAYGLAVILLPGPVVLLVSAFAITLGATPIRTPTIVGLGLGLWLGLGFVVGLTLGARRDLPGREGEDKLQTPVKSRPIAVRLAGLVYGIVGVLVGGPVVWHVYPICRVDRWLMSHLPSGFVTGLAVELAEGEGSPQGPLESWRNDRVFGLVTGLAFGLTFGIVVGLGFGLAAGSGADVGFGHGSGAGFGLSVGLAYGLGFGLSVGLVYGITSSETWSTFLAWRFQLQRSSHVSVSGLVPFLEDARDRGVLRTVGAVYQFRHATLQDQLAQQATASPAMSLAAQRTW
jgi:hypothetical protein